MPEGVNLNLWRNLEYEASYSPTDRHPLVLFLLRHTPLPSLVLMVSLDDLVTDEPSARYVEPTTRISHYLATVPCQHRTRDGLYPDFGVQIVDGVVWFWLLEQWQDLPNELWAWKYVTVWTAAHYYHTCSLWVPNLLLFDFWEYDRSSYAPVSAPVIDRQPVPSVTATIAPRLSQILRSSGDSELCRTCRLVCRDWANALRLGDPERCDLRLEDGVVWYRIEEAWRHLSQEYWAWTLREKEWWVERHQDRWQLKLVQPVDDSVRRNPKYPSAPLYLSDTPRRSGFSRASALPQEILKYICDAADSDSWSSRLVCRYWNTQCTPHVFKEISGTSPVRIRVLWMHRRDPTMHHLEVIKHVPEYNSGTKFPWLHLLTQLCTSTQSVWTDQNKETSRITIWRPFTGGHRTMRSVHFALPRSLPRSLSRGIKSLFLQDVECCRFEDLTHLVCELPDLEELFCAWMHFDSPPIELPRRPRTNRNKLKKVDIGTDETKFLPAPSTLRLLLSVYAASSFFSGDEIAVLLALLQLCVVPLLDDEKPSVCYEDSPCNHSRRIRYFYNYDPDRTILDLHVLQDPERNRIAFNIVADCRSTTADEDVKHWTRLDTQIGKIDSEGLIHKLECVFGFNDREEMVRFATTVLATKMPSVSRLAVVRYSVHVSEQWFGKWYRASLDSEELTGTGTKDLGKVYS